MADQQLRVARTVVSLLVAVSVGVLVLSPGATGKAPVKPKLYGSVSYTQPFDGPIDCGRAPTFLTSAYGSVPKGTKGLAEIEANYRPRSGATLTVSGQSFPLTLSKKILYPKSNTMGWQFRPIPITTDVGERAGKATIRYKTRRGAQKLATNVFFDVCV
jgi:hypothetical protein